MKIGLPRRLRRNSVPPHLAQHGHADAQRSGEEKDEADHAVDADGLAEADHRQKRCQNGLDQIDEGGLGRGGVFRDLGGEQKAEGGAEDADVAQQQRGPEREAGEERHVGENVQPETAVERADGGDVTEQQEREQLQPAEDHVEGRDDQPAEPRDAQLAECAVHGEENGRREDLREAARTDLELRGVENEEDADQLDADGNEVVPFQRLVQDQVRGGEGKDRVARVDDGGRRGVHVQHGHLEQRHVQRDRQKAKQGKVAPVGAGEANGVPPQAAQGEGQQKERADEHALDRDLHGREDAAEPLERDLGGGVDHGGEQNIKITAFPVHGVVPPFPVMEHCPLYAHTPKKARKKCCFPRETARL